MVFGWKTEYEKRLPTDDLTNWEVFALLEQSCKELEWEYLFVDECTFTATTPTHWTLSEEIITITVQNGEIKFRSQSESLELYEAGRNQKNIEENLLPVFRKTKWKWTPEELKNRAVILKAEVEKQLKSGSRVASEKVTFGLRGHGVTFLLIGINILVFAIMTIRGITLHEPTAEQLIAWGGNARVYVTAGQWWRLFTAPFVHPGITQLVINLCGIYFIGLLVERILGTVKYFIAYLVAGALANLITIIYLPEGVNIGASGAIFGMYGVLIAFAATNYINKKFPTVWLVCIGAYAIFNFYVSIRTGADEVTNIGGIVAGLFVGFLFYYFHFRKNLARAGGTRISIEIMLLTALFIFLYLKKNGRNDSLAFEKAVMQLNQIEVKAMAQMQKLQEKSNEQASKFLRDTALPEWKHFQKEISKTDAYSLDSEFKQKRKLLSAYAALRVQQTELIYKSIHEETTKYDSKIESVSQRIDQIIDQLGSQVSDEDAPAENQE